MAADMFMICGISQNCVSHLYNVELVVPLLFKRSECRLQHAPRHRFPNTGLTDHHDRVTRILSLVQLDHFQNAVVDDLQLGRGQFGYDGFPKLKWAEISFLFLFQSRYSKIFDICVGSSLKSTLLRK